MKTTYSFNIWNHILQDGNSKFLAFYVEKFKPFLTENKLFNWQIVQTHIGLFSCNEKED